MKFSSLHSVIEANQTSSASTHCVEIDIQIFFMKDTCYLAPISQTEIKDGRM